MGKQQQPQSRLVLRILKNLRRWLELEENQWYSWRSSVNMKMLLLTSAGLSFTLWTGAVASVLSVLPRRPSGAAVRHPRSVPAALHQLPVYSWRPWPPGFHGDQSHWPTGQEQAGSAVFVTLPCVFLTWSGSVWVWRAEWGRCFGRIFVKKVINHRKQVG